MNGLILTIGIVVAIGAIFSVPVMRASNRRQPSHGRRLAIAFHFIAVFCYVGITPAILAGSLLVGPLKLGIPFGLMLLAIAMISLIIYAAIERKLSPSLIVKLPDQHLLQHSRPAEDKSHGDNVRE